MTDTATLTPAELEARITALERRLGVDPAALVPPITIGELTDVPVPGSQLAAAWAQEVSSRIVQRFPNVTALKAWAAPAGAYAIDLATGVEWRRMPGGWSQVTPWTGAAQGIPIGGSGSAALGTVTLATVNVPADPGPRVLTVSAFVVIEKWMPAPVVSVRIEVTGAGAVAQGDISPENDPSPIAGLRVARSISLTAGNIAEASPAVVNLKIITSATGDAVATRLNLAYNRLDVIATPRGY